MKRPRCGVPDVSHAGFRNRRSVPSGEASYGLEHDPLLARRLVKRYSLQGERWSHTNLTWNLKPLPALQNSPEYLDKDLIRRELGYALDLWARYTYKLKTSLTISGQNVGNMYLGLPVGSR